MVHTPEIVDDLDVAVVLPHLLRNNIIMKHHVESLSLRCDARWERAMKLISILKRRGPTAFDTFVAALIETNQLDLSNLLK